MAHLDVIRPQATARARCSATCRTRRGAIWLLLTWLGWGAAATAQDTTPGAGLRLETGEGAITGELSALIEEVRQPLAEPVIAEGAEAVILELRSERTVPTQLYVDFVAVDVFGLQAQTRLDGEVRQVQPDQSWTLELRQGRTALAPGDYRIDVAVEEGDFVSLDLRISPVAPPAERISLAQWPPGFNLALADLGGTVVRYSSQFNERTPGLAGLIDGFPVIYDESGGTRSRGWQTEPRDFPAEVVLAFHEERSATIHAVVIDSAGLEYDNPGVAKHVEILVADSAEDSAFRPVAEARLWPVYDAQAIRFDPVPARFVKLRVLSAHNNSIAFGIGELAIIEAPAAETSILADRDINLVLPTLGGSIEHFTSQDGGNPAWRLTDQGVGERFSWMAREEEGVSEAVLPQDFVFAFKHGRAAWVDRVVIDPESQPSYSIGNFSDRWPALASVSVSNSLEGPFTEIARTELAQEPGPVAVPVDRQARYVQVRILENHGGPNTTLGEIAVIEGKRPGYDSVVTQVAEPPPQPVARVGAQPPDTHEPNDQPQDASDYVLGETQSGNLHNSDDVDWYRFEVPGEETRVLNLELQGDPALGIRVALQNTASGSPPLAFAGSARPTTTLSWQVAPGEQLLQVADLPLSVVLVWDGSGSMEGRMEALETAIRRYLGELAEDEAVQLVHFSDRPTVLLEDFSADPDQVWPALEGRFEADGATALGDALRDALALLQPRTGRKAVILFTDGHDSASSMPMDAVEAAVQDAGAHVYTIGLGASLHNYSLRMGGSGTRFLQRVAEASNGRHFHAADVDALDPIFQTIAAELRTAPQYSFRASLAEGTGLLEVSALEDDISALSPPHFELILDASGSMRERTADGRTRMEVAKEVLKATVDSLPAGVSVALRTFGRQIREGQPGDCEDSELLVPFGTNQAALLTERIDEVVALGTTPIAYSLGQAVADLAELDQEDALIVLVTDGEEECEPDLQGALISLQEQGVDFRLNIVGFEIDDAAVGSMLEALASQADGAYVSSAEAGTLDAAIRRSLSARFVVEDFSGRQIATGLVGQAPLELPAGVYRLRVESSTEVLDLVDIRITTDRTTVVELSKAGAAMAASMRTE